MIPNLDQKVQFEDKVNSICDGMLLTDPLSKETLKQLITNTNSPSILPLIITFNSNVKPTIWEDKPQVQVEFNETLIKIKVYEKLKISNFRYSLSEELTSTEINLNIEPTNVLFFEEFVILEVNINDEKQVNNQKIKKQKIFILVNRKNNLQIIGYLRLIQFHVKGDLIIWDILNLEIFDEYKYYGFTIDLVATVVGFGLNIIIRRKRKSISGYTTFGFDGQINKYFNTFLLDILKYSQNEQLTKISEIAGHLLVNPNDRKREIEFKYANSIDNVVIKKISNFDWNKTGMIQNEPSSPIDVIAFKRYLSGKDQTYTAELNTEVEYDGWTYDLPWDWSKIKKIKFGQLGQL